MKVHLNLGGGLVACGYRRWRCQVLSSVLRPEKVTCLRCLKRVKK